MDSLTMLTLVVGAIFYTIATVMYVLGILRIDDAFVAQARRFLLLGGVGQLLNIGTHCIDGFHPLMDVSGALNLIGLIVVGGYLATTIKFKLTTTGALISPLALVTFLAAAMVPHSAVEDLQNGSMMLGKLHLVLIALGVSAFALAAAISTVYLLQESALKHKRVALFGGQSMALMTLDTLARRFVLVGFPIFTMAVVTGYLWMKRTEAMAFRFEHLIAACVWLMFAGVISLRQITGLRGRKAAILTVSGFCAIGVILTLYFLRRVIAG